MAKNKIEFDALKIEQLKHKFNKISSIDSQCSTQYGWINFIRASFGMTLKTLAQRCGVSKSAISNMEKREKQGKITLESLGKIAQSIDCHLIYAIVPNEQYDKYIINQAEKKATKIVERANTQMELEGQKVTTKMKDRIKRLTTELIRKGDIW
ncbi:MAG: helix-turn-helix domain-containing protein [Bacteriovoracaceae bacterium]|nr:helix-turn-helix domain-containing protein [Bacteriovoracaceae bacterium]